MGRAARRWKATQAPPPYTYLVVYVCFTDVEDGVCEALGSAVWHPRTSTMEGTAISTVGHRLPAPDASTGSVGPSWFGGTPKRGYVGAFLVRRHARAPLRGAFSVRRHTKARPRPSRRGSPLERHRGPVSSGRGLPGPAVAGPVSSGRGKSERRQVQAPTAALGTPPQGVLPTQTGVGLGAGRTTEVEPNRHEVSFLTPSSAPARTRRPTPSVPLQMACRRVG